MKLTRALADSMRELGDGVSERARSAATENAAAVAEQKELTKSTLDDQRGQGVGIFDTFGRLVATIEADDAVLAG